MSKRIRLHRPASFSILDVGTGEYVTVKGEPGDIVTIADESYESYNAMRQKKRVSFDDMPDAVTADASESMTTHDN